jgi:uncharacterized coiled-coil protein SlyX
MDAACTAFKSALERCSNALTKLTATFSSLNERQLRLPGDQAVPGIVPILTNVETQLAQYDILTASENLLAVQATRISELEAELATTNQQLTAANQQLASSHELAATLVSENERLKAKLEEAEESLAQRPYATLPAANTTPSLPPPTSSNTNFAAEEQLPPTPTSASAAAETSARTKRQVTSPSKPQTRPKRIRQDEAGARGFATAQDEEQQQGTSQPTAPYDAKAMAKTIYDMFRLIGPWTQKDKDNHLASLESAYVREKTLEDRIEKIDRHCFGNLEKWPPDPRPCLFAEITSFSPKGSGGPNMKWQDCRYCQKSPNRRCTSAKFAPNVPLPFGQRDNSTGAVPRTDRKYNYQESATGESIRWDAYLREGDPPTYTT